MTAVVVANGSEIQRDRPREKMPLAGPLSLPIVARSYSFLIHMVHLERLLAACGRSGPSYVTALPAWPLSTADSTDRRNALSKAFCRCLEVERLPGAFVQPPSDGIELALSNIRQIHPLREVLAQ